MSSIKGTLERIRIRLNEFLIAADPRPDPWVILSNIVDLQGIPYEEAKNKVVMLLANIQKETTVSTYRPATAVSRESFAQVAPPLHIDLFLLFFANFQGKSYADGLAAISRVISFFQRQPCFTHADLPGLDPRIDRLRFDLCNLELMELSYLLGLTGAKYLPSVYYKMRTIPFQSGAMQAEVPAVRGLEAPGDLA